VAAHKSSKTEYSIEFKVTRRRRVDARKLHLHMMYSTGRCTRKPFGRSHAGVFCTGFPVRGQPASLGCHATPWELLLGLLQVPVFSTPGRAALHQEREPQRWARAEEMARAKQERERLKLVRAPADWLALVLPRRFTALCSTCCWQLAESREAALD
jgi:hypothetical protein